MAKAAQLDSSWDPEALKQHVEHIFYSYQKDWGNFNSDAIASYTTQHYAYHNWLMLSALHQLNRRNLVENPAITTIEFVNMNDSTQNDQDTFTAYVAAHADDKLIDTRDNSVIYTDSSPFSEYWHFVRSPHNTWILSGISQLTAKNTPKTGKVIQFAFENNLYFSLDWGWLLLPKMGYIFRKADFKKSDINNHCIGLLDNKLLVQLYTYVPGRDNNNSNAHEFVVCQVAVPRKQYGRIVVEQKSAFSFLKRTPKGLNKLQTESIDINKRFNIYAETVEQVTTFELLNPGYMQKVLDTPGKFNIEVYDNTIFIYSKDKKASYDNLFSLIKLAYKELRM